MISFLTTGGDAVVLWCCGGGVVWWWSYDDRMMYYFGFFVVVSLIMCICAFATYDTTMGLGGRPLPPAEAWQFSCQQINTALSTVGYAYVYPSLIRLMRFTVSASNLMVGGGLTCDVM